MIYDHIYAVWKNMRHRCNDPHYGLYHRYGGRGITVYGPWQNSLSEFQRYVLENLGPRPEGCSLDRIENDGNYEPGNIRWATLSQQNCNKSNNHSIEDRYIYRHHSGWAVHRTINKERRYFGVYQTVEEARAVRDKTYERYPPD